MGRASFAYCFRFHLNGDVNAGNVTHDFDERDNVETTRNTRLAAHFGRKAQGAELAKGPTLENTAFGLAVRAGTRIGKWRVQNKLSEG